MSIRLTPEEIRKIEYKVIISNTSDVNVIIETQKCIATAQIKKIYDWGNEKCPHVHHVLPNRDKHACPLCWQELIKEIG